MNLIQILLLKSLIVILYGCNSNNENIQLKKLYSANECEIVEVHDRTLHPGRTVIGYKFICNKSDTIKELSLLENNPWRHVEFPSLQKENPYLGFGSHFEAHRKDGFIYYDLQLSSWDEVKSKFNVTTDLNADSLLFTYAKTDCRTKAYLPKYVLTNYWLSFHGVKDTLQLKKQHTFFLENQIKVFAANGDTIIDLISYDFVSTGAQIDSSHSILIFRTWRKDSITDYSGIQIYKIANDSMLLKFELASDYLVFTPVLFGNYAVIEINKDYFSANRDLLGSHPYQTLVYDIAKNLMYERLYPKDYKYRFSSVSGHYLIYSVGDDVRTPLEYDSVKIADLNIMPVSK